MSAPPPAPTAAPTPAPIRAPSAPPASAPIPAPAAAPPPAPVSALVTALAARHCPPRRAREKRGRAGGAEDLCHRIPDQLEQRRAARCWDRQRSTARSLERPMTPPSAALS